MPYVIRKRIDRSPALMRVLLFLEPVVFRNDPAFLANHFIWVKYFARTVQGIQGAFALAANATVCHKWQEMDQAELMPQQCFPLDSFKVLSEFRYKRTDYARALYGSGEVLNSLTSDLFRICAEFKPDLIVMTSQNALARKAFSGIPVLSIEQAPLPRLGHPFRTMFDPNGHQTGSMLETHTARIKALPFEPSHYEQLRGLLSAIRSNATTVEQRALEAQYALASIRREGRVALLVTQPPDWVTYEGAYQDIALEALLYAWATRLPAGWIGVPTYHPGLQLSAEMEAELARACPRLRFLPRDLSQGLTEPLVLHADGMVTISSTSAMTGLLFQKRVIVCGRSPFNAWCFRDAAHLEDALPLTLDEAASTLGFLTHRYSLAYDHQLENLGLVASAMHAVTSANSPSEWFMDLSDWSIDRARSLFHLNVEREADPAVLQEAA